MYREDKMIEVAKILKPHGLKGELKLSPYTYDEKFWKKVKTLYIDNSAYTVNSSRLYKEFVYISLSEINDCNTAESFRGRVILASKSDLSLNEDEYLISDLEGCAVVDEFGKLIGYVESIEKYGSADIINLISNGARRSFPFLEKVIKNVDIQNKKVVVYKDKIEEVLIWK